MTFWTDPVMLNHKYIYVKSAICRRKEAATVEEVMEKVLRSGMDLLVGIGRYALPALAFLIVLRCLFSLLRNARGLSRSAFLSTARMGMNFC